MSVIEVYTMQRLKSLHRARYLFRTTDTPNPKSRKVWLRTFDYVPLKDFIVSHCEGHDLTTVNKAYLLMNR